MLPFAGPFAPGFALAGGPAPVPPRREKGSGIALAFDAIGFKRRDEEPPERPTPRAVSPAARAWSWIMVAILVAALLLPFSLAAVTDLVFYLGR